MRFLIPVVAYFFASVSASGNNESLVCSDPPMPITVIFGDAPLGSFRDTPQLMGYGLRVTLGGEAFAPRIELVGSPGVGVRVSQVARNCTQLTPFPLDCKLDSSYPPSTGVMAGGVYSDLYSGGRLNYPVAAENRDASGSGTLELSSTIIDNFTFQYNRDQMSDSSRGLATLVSSYINLGPSSTFLRKLFTDGLIASRSWSFFGGLLGTSDELEMIDLGVLVIGGFHPTQVKGGGFKEFPLPEQQDNSCLFPIEISGVEWFGKDAINSSLPDNQPFTACINPGSNRFEFPIQIWETLEGFSLAGGIQSTKNISHNQKPVNSILPVDQQGLIIDDYQFQVENNASPGGLSSEKLSMKIKVKNGPEIVIPPNQIFQRRRKISKTGEIEVEKGPISKDGSVSDRRAAVITYPDQSTGMKPTFGLPFLSTSYLTVNYDAGTFGLAPVNGIMSGDFLLEPFLPPACSPTVAPEKKPALEDQPVSRAIEAKVVAPVVIGSVIGLTCMVIAIFWIRKKCKLSLSGPFIRKAIIEKPMPEMDATGPFEHEVEGKPIYELSNDCESV